MQTTPDLVFLNCCHLGSMQRDSGGPRRAGSPVASRPVRGRYRQAPHRQRGARRSRPAGRSTTRRPGRSPRRSTPTSSRAGPRALDPRGEAGDLGPQQQRQHVGRLPGVRAAGVPARRPQHRRGRPGGAAVAARAEGGHRRLGLEAADADDLEAESVGRRLQELGGERLSGGSTATSGSGSAMSTGCSAPTPRPSTTSTSRCSSGAPGRACGRSRPWSTSSPRAALPWRARGRRSGLAEFERAELLLSGLEAIVAAESPMLALMRAAYHKHRLTSTDGEKLTDHLRLAYEDYALRVDRLRGERRGRLRLRVPQRDRHGLAARPPDPSDGPRAGCGRPPGPVARSRSRHAGRRPSNGSGSRTPCSSRLWSREPCTRSGSSSCAATRTSSPPGRAGGIG